jgi:hypothetical protein
VRDFIPAESYVGAMLIWILGIILLALFGYVGFCMGAIRLLAWALGLIVGGLLAPSLGHIFYPLLKLLGATSPVLQWFLGPFLAFIVILIVFKVIGQTIHHKVDVYYKYKAGDLIMGLFNRLNARLGIAVGMLNGAIYLILISWVIYVTSYWTFQMASGDQNAWSVRMLNLAGEGLQSSGMAKVAAAVDKMPDSYFQAADIIGLIYHNDLLESRLTHYPGLLELGQRPEWQDIGSDQQFTELRQRQPPISEIMNNPKVAGIINNPTTVTEIWNILLPNLTDLQNYLATGESEKYGSEKILGKWDYDLSSSLNAVKRAKGNIGYQEMQRTKQAMALVFANTTVVVAPDPSKLVVLKNLGKLHPGATPKAPPTVDLETFRGTWSNDGSYQFMFPDRSSVPLSVTVDGNRITVTGDPLPMVFEKEE